MLSKKVLKDIQSLSLKKNRDETGLFMAEGPKIVEDLVTLVPANVKAVYATEEWAMGRTGVEIITEAELQRISLLKTPNKVVAVLQKLPTRPPDLSRLVVYLDTIQDPGNFGTIIRIADWFGIKDVVCSAGCADLYNPKVVQSTMASLARVNVFEDKGEDWLAKQALSVYAASLHGENLYTIPKADKGILIIGNESKGIRPEFLDLANYKVTIPRRGEAESLNAAVATGILLSHLMPVS
jgi:RNA methyltransferase, TrmH family